MKFSVLALFLLTGILACNPSPKKETLNTDPKTTLNSFRSWWDYNYRNINLTRKYSASDKLFNPISREAFLQALASGEYVPFKVNTADASLKYQLHRLDKSTLQDIKATARTEGQRAYARYLQEGKEIPDFNYKDLNGKLYDRENTKGKVVLIKCWFVHCTACIKEMPELNKFVDENKERNDILFLSLAYDSEEELKAFLKKTKFNYAVIHAEPEYFSERLDVHAYPTHFVVNREGKIAKVVGEYQDMIAAAKEELAK